MTEHDRRDKAFEAWWFGERKYFLMFVSDPKVARALAYIAWDKCWAAAREEYEVKPVVWTCNECGLGIGIHGECGCGSAEGGGTIGGGVFPPVAVLPDFAKIPSSAGDVSALCPRCGCTLEGRLKMVNGFKAGRVICRQCEYHRYW